MNRRALVSAGVLFVLLATVGLLRLEPERQFTATSYGTAPFGYKAAFDLLLESGLPVRRNLENARKLPEGATIWWIEPTSLCRGDDEQSGVGLDEWSGRPWLERGGTAVVFLPAHSASRCFSVAGSELPPRPQATPTPATMATPVAAAVESLFGDDAEATPRALRGPRLRRERRLTVPNLGTFGEAKDWSVAAAVDGQPFILERQVGGGRLVVVGDPRFVSNHWLERADAAPLLMDVALAYGTPLIDERDHGFGAGGGTFSYLWHSAARPALLGLAFLGLAFAWWGAALSPPTAAVDERPAPTLESYVDSLAALYARAGDHAAVAVRYREVAVAQLRRHSSLPADTPGDILIERLRRQQRIDAAEARLLAETPPVSSAADLQNYARQLDGHPAKGNHMTTAPIDVRPIAETYHSLRAAVGKVVVGQDEALRLCFSTLLCAGHSLIEGVPGVAKTLLVRTLAGAVDVRFGRVQFTPDLMPSDILGTSVFDPRDASVRFRAGPLFTDLLLADEINRASAKTQSALLEAMQERTATVDGEAHPLGPYFTVFATQNPVEQEGTYPLPEAELDRFLFKIVVRYPSEENERSLLALHHPGDVRSERPVPVLQRDAIDAMRAQVAQVIVRDEIVAYVATLVRATRNDLSFSLGASPRAGVMLLRAAKANAALEGRDFVLPEDVQETWLPALRHRVQLDPAAEVEGLNADEALTRTLRGIAVPR